VGAFKAPSKVFISDLAGDIINYLLTRNKQEIPHLLKVVGAGHGRTCI
jgi:hypothetical protein